MEAKQKIILEQTKEIKKPKKGGQKMEKEKPNNVVLDLAIKSGDTDTVKKILFFQKFQKFQAECPTIKKTQKVITAYSEYYYEPLEGIRQQIQPYLTKYSLTYRWNFTDSENDILCTCIITDAETGYEITSSMKSAKDNTFKNNVQAVGSTMTYLQRYTLVAVLGLTGVDTDDDAVSSTPVVELKLGELIPEIPMPKKKSENKEMSLFGGENDNQKS